MKTTHNIKLAAFALALAFTAATAQTNIWSGNADTTWYTSNKYASTYTITTAEELAGLALLVNGVSGESGNGTYGMSSKTIKLGNDIALNNTTNWQDWETTPPANTWTAIGTGVYSTSTGVNSFKGTFDGNGHVISGVYINKTNTNQGLFGSLNLSLLASETGTIKNLGVVDSYIKGRLYTGGLVGYMYSNTSSNASVVTIQNSYFIGTVTGSDNVGGLAGNNQGIISNSYSIGSVTGGNYVGGLVGNNESEKTISNSYSASAVTGSGSYVGGLIGRNVTGGAVINCYYDKTISGQTDTEKGIGKTTADMQSQDFADNLNAGATLLSMNAWDYSAGNYLVLNNTPASANIADYFASGDGTEANPYIITTKGQLESLSAFVSLGKNFSGEYFKLGNNIALNNTANWQNWETTPPDNSWTVIGTYITSSNNRPFQGTFDGDSHVISGIYINNATAYQGLFSYLGSGGTIKNLGIEESYIKGGQYVGSLAGYITGSTVSKCYSTGTVSGSFYIGGLVGYIYSGTVSNSYSTGMVTGSLMVGGLVGYISNSSGIINNSYSTGMAGSLSGSVGGLVGSNFGKINNSYYDIDISGQSDEGKGEGKTTAEMKDIATYVDWDFEDIWKIDSAINDGYPYLLGVNIEDPDPEVYPLTVTNGTGSGSYTEGETVIISANQPPADKRFKEWSITPAVTYLNGTNKTSEEAEFAMPAQAVTATAIYEDLPPTHHAIEITTNGNGIANPSATSAPQGTEITLTVTPNAGYRFKEWQIISGGISIVNNKFTMPNAAVEAKAIFELIPYTVTFNSQEGSAVAPQTINHGAKATAPTAPTREGYTFAGWFKEAAGTTLWDFATDVVTGDVTLFAKWEIEITPIISAKPATGGVIVQTIGKDIVLSNLPSNAKVEVFGLNGKRVGALPATPINGTLRITVQTKGMYIVRVGRESLRIVVR